MDSSNTVIVSVMVEEKGKQAEERQDEPRLWRPWRPPRRRRGWRVLWAVGMVVAVLTTMLTTALLIVNLYPEIWKGLLEGRVLTLVALGFSVTAIIVLLAIAGARRSWTGFQGKTVWDFLQLLIVPLMLVAIGFWFTAQQDARQQKIEKKRAEAEQELAVQRAQDEALQAYLSQMSSLLLEKDLRASEEKSEVRTLARARTLTVLGRLDPSRKKAVMQFLLEAELVQKVEGRDPIIRLSGANLSGTSLYKVNLGGIYLQDTNLSHTNLGSADLSNADLSNADLANAALVNAKLSDANLVSANLSHAKLGYADLSGASVGDANLSHANLSNADLNGADLVRVIPRSGGVLFVGGADLRYADLRYADLSNADLSNADLYQAILEDTKLHEAVLSDAYLRGVQGKTNVQLAEQAKSLADAVMPNGQLYEDWLKDREGRKQNE